VKRGLLDKVLRRPPPSGRVLEAAAYVETEQRRKAAKGELVARLYRYRDKLLVCRVAGFAEVGAPQVFGLDVEHDTLGATLLDALLAYEPEGRGVSGQRLTDWPAYVASGARSVRQFEERLWHVDLVTVFTSIRLSARPRSGPKQHMGATAEVHPTNLEVGRAAREVIACAMALRAAGLV
jgi:hypothetical protein